MSRTSESRRRKRPPSSKRQRLRPVVVISLRHPEDLEGMADGLLEEARRRGWSLLDLSLTTGVLADLPSPAGAITTRLPDDPISLQLRSLGVPVVRLGKLEHPEDSPLIPVVYPSHREHGRMIAEYFADRRFGQLACVMHEGHQMMREVFLALSERAVRLGCVCHQHLLRSPSASSGLLSDQIEHRHARMSGITDWLKGLPKPVGVVAYSDAMAAQIGVLCRVAGLEVPERVSILGIGNKPVWCEMAPVPISSLDINRREITRVTIRILDQMMQGESSPPARTPVPPVGIVTRRSTDILAAGDPVVVQAIRFMWDHLDRDLSVDDVSRQMGVPRYKLERAFRRHLGRGIKAEHLRARMERCRELLRSTDLPIIELAPKVGFRTPEYFHNTFRKAFGMTPRRYRLQSIAGEGGPGTGRSDTDRVDIGL